MKPRINIITYVVDDLVKSIAFYKGGLDLPTKGMAEGQDHILFELQRGLSLVLCLRAELDMEDNQSSKPHRLPGVVLSHTADSKERSRCYFKKCYRSWRGIITTSTKEYEWG